MKVFIVCLLVCTSLFSLNAYSETVEPPVPLNRWIQINEKLGIVLQKEPELPKQGKPMIINGESYEHVIPNLSVVAYGSLVTLVDGKWIVINIVGKAASMEINE